jgi:hypothetical protein
MKKLLFGILFTLAIVNCGFSEIQMDSNIGWFFENNTYTDGEKISRSIRGPMLSVIARYFPFTSFGVFLGLNSDITLSANNDEYVTLFTQAGMDTEVAKDFGDKISIKFGVSLSYPVTQKMFLQSDIGAFYTFWGIEAITGTISYRGRKYNAGIFPDIKDFGVLGSVFGSYVINEAKQWYITFGLRLNYIFWREEKTEVIISGTSEIISDKPSFYGLGIAPFIGYMGKY